MAETALLRTAGREIAVETLVDGPAARGRGLALTAPISFWGGVDPRSGRIVDVRHPQHGALVAGAVLMLPGTIGSSSASAVLLELVHRGLAPAAILMPEPDAILLLGLLAAGEMGWSHPPAYRLARELQAGLDGVGIAIG